MSPEMNTEICQGGHSLRQVASSEELLLREFMHRTNNEFASVISLVTRAAARSKSDEIKAALKCIADRLHSYAGVQRALSKPPHSEIADASEYLRSLCLEISNAKLSDRGINLTYVTYGESAVHLNAEHCWKLGMIVAEMISNAERHAFGEGGGRIRVELASSGAYVECRVSDNGCCRGPIVAGQGTKIMRSLADDLGGGISQLFDSGGTVSSVRFSSVAHE